jgi:hypothetical protein
MVSFTEVLSTGFDLAKAPPELAEKSNLNPLSTNSG